MKILTLLTASLLIAFSSCTNDGAENPANSAESPDNTGPDRIHYQEQLEPGTYYGDTTIGVNADTSIRRDTTTMGTTDTTGR